MRFRGTGLGFAFVDLPSDDFDLVAGFAEDLRHEGLAHRHLFLVGEAAIEDLRDRTASPRFTQHRFQADHFPPHPQGLRLRPEPFGLRFARSAIGTSRSAQRGAE